MRTQTERGLHWLVVSLALAFVANAVLLANLLRLYVAGGGDFGLSQTLDLVWDVLLFACVVPGFVGFWRVLQGKSEFGVDHASDVRRGTLAFLVGSAGAVAFLATGLVLGSVYVPMSTVGGAAIRAVHEIGPLLITTFVGLFLLWTLWRLGGGVVRSISMVSLTLGLVPLGMALVALGVSIPLTLFLAVACLPSVSLAGWLAACVLVAMRLRGVSPGRVAYASAG